MISKYEQYVGTTIGYRTILGIHPNEKTNHVYFWCRCECGHEGQVLAINLIRGKQISCGCKNAKKMIDLTGFRFGKWIVLNREENYIRPLPGSNTKYGKKQIRTASTQWKCQCDCGNIQICLGGMLRAGKTLGCRRCKTHRESEDGGVLSKYNKVRSSALNSGKSWNIEKDLWEVLVIKNCFYCNRSPEQIHLEKRYNGLDRYDNDEGYCNNNVVPCCWSCNKRKGSSHGDDFLKEMFDICENNS
jgi:hypothetical protein